MNEINYDKKIKLQIPMLGMLVKFNPWSNSQEKTSFLWNEFYKFTM